MGKRIKRFYFVSQDTVYEDANMRSYFGSIRPPARLTFGFRLGRPEKDTRASGGHLVKSSRSGVFILMTIQKKIETKGQGKDSTRSGSTPLSKKMRRKTKFEFERKRSNTMDTNLSKSLRVRGAFKHPKDAGVVNDTTFLIENDDSFRKSKFLNLFFPKKFHNHLFKMTLPAVCPSLNYSGMQYLLNRKNKIHFDLVVVLIHFVASGVAEPSMMGERMRREKA
ncbi:hypothetical protein Lal_00042941 [Lupinus albus]|nr:hypothetical protein Lal_00042941 [Lupinus albus]